MSPMAFFFSFLSPVGAKARLSVFIFHRVLPEPNQLFSDEMHARRFDEVCGWLKSWFNVLPLDQAVARLKTGMLPARVRAPKSSASATSRRSTRPTSPKAAQG